MAKEVVVEFAQFKQPKKTYSKKPFHIQHVWAKNRTFHMGYAIHSFSVFEKDISSNFVSILYWNIKCIIIAIISH